MYRDRTQNYMTQKFMKNISYMIHHFSFHIIHSYVLHTVALFLFACATILCGEEKYIQQY